VGVVDAHEPDSDTDPTANPLEPRVLRAGVWLTIAAVAVQTILHLGNIVSFDRSFTLLDVDSDLSLWAWASTAAEAAAAATAALLAVLPRRIAWRLVLLAALLAFLSADDILALHERISVEQLGPIPHAARLVWVVVWAPILGLTGLLLFFESRRVPSSIGRLVIRGLVMLAVAVVMEAATPILFALGFDHGSLPYEAEAVVEEGLELAGFLLIWTGLAATVVHRVPAEAD
jgi:hypothetical protein